MRASGAMRCSRGGTRSATVATRRGCRATSAPTAASERCSASSGAIEELAAQDLAHLVAGQLVDRHEPGGDLVRREVLAAELDQPKLIQPGPIQPSRRVG